MPLVVATGNKPPKALERRASRASGTETTVAERQRHPRTVLDGWKNSLQDLHSLA